MSATNDITIASCLEALRQWGEQNKAVIRSKDEEIAGLREALANSTGNSLEWDTRRHELLAQQEGE